MQKDFKTVWVSDIHLGTPYCKAQALASFLKKYTFEKLYLVGDVVDGWMIKEAGLFWPDSHNLVIRRILEKSEKQGTNVVYIPGNHDEFLKGYANDYTLSLGQVRILLEDFHVTTTGKKLWITHGDHYDILMKVHKALNNLGPVGKVVPYIINKSYGYLTKRKRGKKVKPSKIGKRIRRIVEFVDRFEGLLSWEAKKKDCDGVVCGHVHNPQIKKLNNAYYLNCGDWVGSCTAIVENYDGSIDLLKVVEEFDEEGNIIYNTEKIKSIMLY